MQVPPFSLSQQIHDLGVDLEEAVLEVVRSGQYIGCLLYTSPSPRDA